MNTKMRARAVSLERWIRVFAMLHTLHNDNYMTPSVEQGSAGNDATSQNAEDKGV